MFTWMLSLAMQTAPPDAPTILEITPLPEEAVKTGVYEGGSDGDPGEPHLANFREVFSSDDYPASAENEGVQGDVEVSLKVSAEGKPTGCLLLDSSGSQALDAVTCRLLMERGRFTPALKLGRPVAAEMKQVVRWRLPSIPFEDHRNRMTLTFDADGMLTSCERKPAAPAPANEREECAKEAKWIADQLRPEERRMQTIVAETGFLVGGPGASSSIGQGVGEKMFWRFEHALTIEADGNVSACRFVGAEEDGEIDRRGCDMFSGEEFEELGPQVHDRSARHGVRYFAVYAKSPRGSTE